jgi:hypothetical protein
MAHIDRFYIAIGVVLLILGEVLGFYMGLAGENQYRPVHVAFVLPGFAVLAIYGMIFRLWPAMKEGGLAALQFWLGTLSAIAIIVGSYQFTMSGAVAVVALGSIGAIVAAALFLFMFWTRSAR